MPAYLQPSQFLQKLFWSCSHLREGILNVLQCIQAGNHCWLKLLLWSPSASPPTPDRCAISGNHYLMGPFDRNQERAAGISCRSLVVPPVPRTGGFGSVDVGFYSMCLSNKQIRLGSGAEAPPFEFLFCLVFTFSRLEYWVTFRDSPHQP